MTTVAIESCASSLESFDVTHDRTWLFIAAASCTFLGRRTRRRRLLFILSSIRLAVALLSVIRMHQISLDSKYIKQWLAPPT